MDVVVVTEVASVGDEQLLANVLDKFSGSQIKMKWSKDNFNYIENSRVTLKYNNMREHSS
ncbi:hypothetical protein PVK06_001546 [Gossypium arboreum]|uniref:Uncharacterized protein n=1 Tax=Gossypium arboreum TaxID=29729 RepID=A0ABR0R2B0_GOSAR|nr:hypothetical protein PVK06_001546 [Gossypium arboreum]